MITTENFQNILRNNCGCTQEQTILISLSGGADSMVLCHLLLEAGFSIAIAHCNFKLRGADSDADEKFVRDYAAAKNIKLHVVEFDTVAYSKAQKLSIEEAARNLRYDFFEALCTEFHYDLIATAHHQNDNAETILLRLTKGTGLLGMNGIPIINGKIIRPLLFTQRIEIEHYCAQHNLNYCHDTTNNENTYQRNKIRNTVIPILQEINPDFINTMSANIAHFKGAYTFYKKAVDKKLNKIIINKGADIFIPIGAFGNKQDAAMLLFELLYPKGFNSEQITQIVSSLGNTGKHFLSDKYRVLLDRKFLIVTSHKEVQNSIQSIPNETNKIIVGDFELSFETSKYNKTVHLNSNNRIAYFDADKITYPLQVRKWQAGDYLYPLGLTRRKSSKPGKQKVSDVLTNAKVNALQKENTFVLLCGDKIIWAIGLRQDARFKLTDSTTKLLKIKMLS